MGSSAPNVDTRCSGSGAGAPATTTTPATTTPINVDDDDDDEQAHLSGKRFKKCTSSA